MKKQDLKTSINERIENRQAEIISLGQEIYNNPETGFKEFKTSKRVAAKFAKLGLPYIELVDIPGVKATFDTGKPGPAVAILGEMDAIVSSTHPHANLETGAVHACGHNSQIAAMLGAAMGIVDTDAAARLTGKIHFIAVPAEEYIEIAFRKSLKEKGIIKYLGGKPELLYRGIFDDVDMCMMIHTVPGNRRCYIGSTWNGFIAKSIRYLGKGAHAAIAPEQGINALYAANLGLTAINAIRETFREDDFIRVHPIITKGGDAVNVIPHEVQMETFVRGKNMEAVISTNKKVNRALIGSAFALGAQVEIEDMPGYFPFLPDKHFTSAAYRVLSNLVDDEIGMIGHETGSTDLGDLSTVMPVIQPCVGGIEGGLHSADFRISDPHTAYILGARFLANMAVELLSKDANLALDILRKFKPLFKTKAEYIASADKLYSRRVYEFGVSI